MTCKLKSKLFICNIVVLKQNLDCRLDNHLLQNLYLALPFMLLGHSKIRESEFIRFIHIRDLEIKLALNLLRFFRFPNLHTDKLVPVQKLCFRPDLIERRLAFVKHNSLSIVSYFD